MTPASLRTKGQCAEEIDNVIHDVEVIFEPLKKANLLFDADAWAELCEVNDQMKAQTKQDPALLAIFRPLIDYLARGPKAPKAAMPAPAPA